MRAAQDLLFFAYRDFTNAADVILAELGLGRAHHRAMHFIGRNPGITVSDLLGILRITKQSLARVLIVTDGARLCRAGARPGGPPPAPAQPDPAGAALERRLFESQRERLGRRLSWRPAHRRWMDFTSVMRGIMDETARAYIDNTDATASWRNLMAKTLISWWWMTTPGCARCCRAI